MTSSGTSDLSLSALVINCSRFSLKPCFLTVQLNFVLKLTLKWLKSNVLNHFFNLFSFEPFIFYSQLCPSFIVLFELLSKQLFHFVTLSCFVFIYNL